MRWPVAIAGVVVVSAAHAAHAAPDLVLRHEPPPTHLRMRPRTAQPAPLPSVVPATPPIATPPTALPITPTDYADLAVRDVKQPVSFSLDLGYQVEATSLTGQASLGGKIPNRDDSFARLRSYGFGEGFLSTRGVGITPLATYFALRFQVAPQLGNVNLATDTEAARSKPPPIASWFERSGTEVRTGWAELKDFLPSWLGLSALRVRAGDFFVYGPWVMHLDGVLAGYEGKLVKLEVYGGVRALDYTRRQTNDRANIFGTSARIDLRGLRRALPIALGLEQLYVSANPASGAPQSESRQYEIDWRPKQDFALIGKLRQLDGKTANDSLEFRGRYRQVSNLVVKLVQRTGEDWRWDPSFGRVDDTLLTARPYLDLGPVLPQVVASARAGTLIAENVDLFAKAAIASDRAPKDQRSTYNASYVELGGALQVRLRRQIAVEGSILSRQTKLATPTLITDVPAPPGEDPFKCATANTCQPLPDAAAIGEAGFTEIGGALRMSLGARKLSAVVEIYGRKTRYAQLYAAMDPNQVSDLRGGGRFTVEAWVNQRVRLYAAYDLSSRFEFQPEITGYKSLRLIMSGTY